MSLTSGREVYKGVAEDSVYITKKYRGMGIRNALLKKLIELSEKKGIWTIQQGYFQKILKALPCIRNTILELLELMNE